MRSRADFDTLQRPADTVSSKLSALENLPTMEQVRSLAKWDADLLEKFDRPATELAGIDRSAGMSELSYLMAEHGWSDEQMIVAIYDLDDRWGKFVERHNRKSLLTDLVNRARQKVGYGAVTPDVKAMIEKFERNDLDTTPDDDRTSFQWGDFVEAEFPIDWMLEGLLAGDGIGLLSGFPGVGKSQMALGMAGALAAGRTRYLGWTNHGGQQRVQFFSLEMAKPSLHLFATKLSGGYTADELALLQRNLTLEVPGQLSLDQEAGQELFERMLERRKPTVVIIDSLQSISSKELTDEVAAKALMQFLAMMRNKYKCAMVIIHHHRKKGVEQQKGGADLSDVYGSTYIAANVDFILSLRALNEDQVEIQTLKNRLDRMRHPMNVTRDGHLHYDEDGAAAFNVKEVPNSLRMGMGDANIE